MALSLGFGVLSPNNRLLCQSCNPAGGPYRAATLRCYAGPQDD